MKTVVITGSARGFGYEMAKLFRKNNLNVVICDISEKALNEAENNLKKLDGEGTVLSYVADITREEDVINLIEGTKKELGVIDIWINNAGVNQPNASLWELDKSTIDRLIDIDLKDYLDIISEYESEAENE